jgi:hypothetical protein
MWLILYDVIIEFQKRGVTNSHILIFEKVTNVTLYLNLSVTIQRENVCIASCLLETRLKYWMLIGNYLYWTEMNRCESVAVQWCYCPVCISCYIGTLMSNMYPLLYKYAVSIVNHRCLHAPHANCTDVSTVIKLYWHVMGFVDWDGNIAKIFILHCTYLMLNLDVALGPALGINIFEPSWYQSELE